MQFVHLARDTLRAKVGRAHLAPFCVIHPRGLLGMPLATHNNARRCAVRSFFKISCLFLRPRLWQFEI